MSRMPVAWESLKDANTDRLHTNAPLGICYIPNVVEECGDDEIVFRWDFDKEAAGDDRGVVRWPRSLLERFLNLRTAQDFLRFARLYGPLALYQAADSTFGNGLRPCPERLRLWDRIAHKESISAWRLVQEDFHELLTMAAMIHEPKTAQDSITLGELIRNDGPDWRKWPRRKQRVFASRWFLTTTGIYAQWCGLYPTMSLYPRPTLVFRDASYSGRIGRDSTLSLFGALTVQLLAAATTRGIAFCSSCGLAFVPGQRQPATDRRRYCVPCRRDGAPHRDAMQDWRAGRSRPLRERARPGHRPRKP